MAEETTEFEKLRKSLRGKSSIVLTDENGVEYTAKFPRKLVKDMEDSGVTSEYVTSIIQKGTVSATDEFFDRFVLPAFNNDCQKMTAEQVRDLFEGLGDPMQVIQALIVLFTNPVVALFEKKNPTQTRTKFRFV